MLDEGRARIFERGRDDWDGTWRMVIYVVPEENRAERDLVRRTLAWHGFGPLAAATWISPHPRLDAVASVLAGLSATRIDLLECRSHGRDYDLAGRAWDCISSRIREQLPSATPPPRAGHVKAVGHSGLRVHVLRSPHDCQGIRRGSSAGTDPLNPGPGRSRIWIRVPARCLMPASGSG